MIGAPGPGRGARTLILGLGNPILTDDAVGLIVAREVYRLLVEQGASVDLAEASAANLDLIALVEGYERLVVVDALIVSHPKPGRLHRLELGDLATMPTSTSLHGLGPAAALELARHVGIDVPDNVSIYGIEVVDPYTFGETLTPALASAIASLPFAIVATESRLAEGSRAGVL